MGIGATGTTSINTTVVYNSLHPGFAVVGLNSTTPGLLVSSSELKSSFAGKEPFQTAATEEDKLYLYHNGTSNSNYVCYHPKAAANRVLINSTSAFLKCIDPTGAIVNNYGSNGCTIPVPWETLDVGPTNANVICVPEGVVQ
jgi:hypothetical protein